MRVASHIAYLAIIAGVALVPPGIADGSGSNTQALSNDFNGSLVSDGGDMGADPVFILNQDLYCFEVEHEDRSIEKTGGTNRERFFSIDRTIPDSQGVAPDPNPGADWDSRVAQCDALQDWDDFHDCMWWPWLFGY